MPTLDWIGKEAVRQHHHEVPFHLLSEVSNLGAGDPNAGNLLVKGDNLVALKALLPYYAGKVKCVYIDPPYNTGNEGWVYNDNVNSPAIREWLGRAVGKEAEDLGRHDKWLCMMYPRLVLLRELLTEDGSLWMSIGDQEVHHARALLDEVFGANCFLADFVWQSKDTPGNNSGDVAVMHNHTLAYRRSKSGGLSMLDRNEKQLSNYSNPDNDIRGDWLAAPLTRAEHRDRDYYPIKNKVGKETLPPKGSSWRRPPEVMSKLAAEDRIWWGVDGAGTFPMEKRFLREAKDGVVARTWWPYTFAGSTRNASAELKEIFGSKIFDTPKPSLLIQRILQIATDPGDLVLDSFAGSGTTGHAVLKQNEEDDGDRRFILIEMEDEVAEPVTAERLRRVVEGYPYEGRDRTELYRQKLEVRNLKKAPDFYAETERLKEERADDYDGFERKMEDAELVLYGVKEIKAKKAGFGGGFRFFEIGEPVYDAEGRLSEAIPYEALARYAFYAQTGRPLEAPAASPEPPLVGVTGDGTAVYLLGGPPSGDGAAPSGVLDRAQLAALPTHDGPRVVWGSACRLGADLLDRHGVTFRQVPYDLRTR